MKKLQEPSADTNGNRINYRFLLWSAKETVKQSVLSLFTDFTEAVATGGVPIELFRFDLSDDRYRLLPNQAKSDLPPTSFEDSAMLIAATVSSLALDRLLLSCDLDMAGHLRDSGPNTVFPYAVEWPPDLAPGPSDVLVVMLPERDALALLMQRRLLTPTRLEEIRSGYNSNV